MKNAYESLSIAIEDLKRKGYTEDYNLCEVGVENRSKHSVCTAADLNVVDYYRFEGDSNPDDNSVLYVIETSFGDKGLLVDAYGAYSGNISREMIEKLRIV
ncbi:phosphoribosylpyrophosphate synthetase [Joostella sp. CR20]|uniref:phosphoribosylpyrophosphate synthetase n=1 Tax=Joostella sp. CR20 TaxID=2804312 RepID=UPI00313EB390